MSNNSFFVYILLSEKFNKFYIGQTAKLEQRIHQHNFSEENNFTSKYRPWVLQLALEVPDRSTAMKIEKYIKGRKSKTYIKKLISEEKLQNKLISKFSSVG